MGHGYGHIRATLDTSCSIVGSSPRALLRPSWRADPCREQFQSPRDTNKFKIRVRQSTVLYAACATARVRCGGKQVRRTFLWPPASWHFLSRIIRCIAANAFAFTHGTTKIDLLASHTKVFVSFLARLDSWSRVKVALLRADRQHRQTTTRISACCIHAQ